MALNAKCGLTALRWALGVVILIEAILFVLPGAAQSFSRTHMPAIVRMILGFGEIVGCVLMLIPQTAVRLVVDGRVCFRDFAAFAARDV